jgi:hypothetical protein
MIMKDWNIDPGQLSCVTTGILDPSMVSNATEA